MTQDGREPQAREARAQRGAAERRPLGDSRRGPGGVQAREARAQRGAAERRPLGDSRRGPGWLLLLCLGCALRPLPAPLDPHLEGGVPEGVPAARPRLGVGVFVDARPPQERTGSAPRLELRWHGLVRRGENSAGDAWFAGDVAQAARADAQATLARSGAFREVRAVATDHADARRGALPPELDYVLVATLESLVAVQHQDSVFSLTVIGFFRSDFDPPRGWARLHYELYDRNGRVWQERVDVEHASPGWALPYAALDALAVANESAAAALHQRLVGERVRRVLAVRVLDACAVGPERARRLVADASRVFAREIATSLEPSYEEWRIPALDLAGALTVAASLAVARDSIVLGLVPLREDLAPGARYGLGVQLGAHAVVGCVPRPQPRVGTVIHEIAHLFGALHTLERASVMFPVQDFDARFFDPLNARVLRASAARRFDGPLEPDVARAIEQLYAEARALEGRYERADVDAGVRALARQAK